MAKRPSALPTLALIFAVTFGWAICVYAIAAWSLIWAVLILIPLITLHASLQHEVIHGHPTRHRWVNALLVCPAFTLIVPYLRFEATHLAHHNDTRLTDPYDDPETAYLAPKVFAGLAPWLQRLLIINNTFAGRVLIGPLIGTAFFVAYDLRAMRSGARDVIWGWMLHIPPMVAVIWLVVASPLPFWAYLIATYGGLSVLKIRTFLEHQAHIHAAARSVIVEDRGPLAFLFLNNNLHVVHHMHPDIPWYRLPRLYAANKDRYLTRNGGYSYRSYTQVMGRYMWRRKDPVAHPLWHK